MTERSIGSSPVDRQAVERRRYARVPLNPDLRSASLAPRTGGELPLPVLDLSPNGAAVVAPVRPSWFDGRVELSLRAAGESIPCRARSTRVCDVGGAPVYGLQLAFEGAAKQAIARAYHKLRFSSLQRRGALSDAALLRLFLDSGYLALKEGLIPSTTWLRADWPATLTHEAVYVTQDEQALGHVTVSRAYSNAWLGHEIATLREHPEATTCRRTLYHHFSVWPRLLDGQNAHLLGYYNRSRPWHRKMFEDFAAKSQLTDCLVLPMDRYTTKSLAEVPASVHARADDARVVEAKADEESEVVRLIERHWPALARRAFDIHPTRLATDCMHEAYRDAGLHRARSVLILLVRDKVAGAALCEWSNSQISLFNVLNLAHVFVDREAAPSPAACDHLARAVRRFYADRSLPPPLLASPPGTFTDVPLTGCLLTETMGCIVWNADGLRLFEHYVDEVLAEATEVNR